MVVVIVVAGVPYTKVFIVGKGPLPDLIVLVGG